MRAGQQARLRPAACGLRPAACCPRLRHMTEIPAVRPLLAPLPRGLFEVSLVAVFRRRAGRPHWRQSRAAHPPGHRARSKEFITPNGPWCYGPLSQALDLSPTDRRRDEWCLTRRRSDHIRALRAAQSACRVLSASAILVREIRELTPSLSKM